MSKETPNVIKSVCEKTCEFYDIVEVLIGNQPNDKKIRLDSGSDYSIIES